MNGVGVFSDFIKQESTLYFSRKKEVYQEKNAQIDIILLWESEKKLFGVIKFDLAKYANMNTSGILDVKTYF